MIFLVAYDRKTQQLTRSVEVFQDDCRGDAYRRRLEVELALPKEEGRYEVVLLEASSLKIIEETHARYFHDVGALVEDAKAELKSTVRRLRSRRKKSPAS